MGIILFLLLNFGPPVFWGFISASPVYPALWATGMTIFGIVIGWRAPNSGVFPSVLVAAAFSFSTCSFAYIIGYGVARIVG